MTVAECVDASEVLRWQRIVEAEYREMPGLSLTRAQIQRMWGLRDDVCDSLIEALVTRRIVRTTAEGTYVAAR